MQHVNAWVFDIAVGLVDQYGKDPAWVLMVMKAKGHGDVDIDAARVWLLANPKGCQCTSCRPPRPSSPARRVDPPLRQLDLFG